MPIPRCVVAACAFGESPVPGGLPPRGCHGGALHADGQCGDEADGFDLVELDEGVAGEDGKRRDTKKTKDSHLPLSLMRGASMGYHLVFVSVKPKT